MVDSPAAPGPRIALVTGAGSGIGRAIALRLAREGARVLVTDLNGRDADRVAKEIAAAGGSGTSRRLDVREPDDIRAAVEMAEGEWGGIDIAVHNAGVGGREAATHEQDPEVWAEVLAVNLTSVWWCMRSVIPGMLERGSGVIVNVASVAGLVGFPRHAAYAASKHGVIGLTRSAALEYARRGIRINAVCPGFTRTPLVERDLLAGDTESVARLARRIPLGRLGTPAEIAAAVAYLCSDDAAFAIGQCLVLDGGATAA